MPKTKCVKCGHNFNVSEMKEVITHSYGDGYNETTLICYSCHENAEEKQARREQLMREYNYGRGEYSDDSDNDSE